MSARLATLAPTRMPHIAAAHDPALPAPVRRDRLLAGLPVALRRVLADGRTERRARFAEDGFDGIAERWVPPAVTREVASMARHALEDLGSSVLAPAPAHHLLGRILALISHYPAKALSAEVEQMVALDWAEDLGDYPAWAIDAAARIWRRSRKWRPSIAEMRALCAEVTAPERELADRLRTLVAVGAAEARETQEAVTALALAFRR